MELAITQKSNQNPVKRKNEVRDLKTKNKTLFCFLNCRRAPVTALLNFFSTFYLQLSTLKDEVISL